MVPAYRGLRCGLDWVSRPLHEDVEFHMRDMCGRGHAIVDDPALHGRAGEPPLHRDLQCNQEPIQRPYGTIHLLPQRVPMPEGAAA
jgi:hypothetical protein